MERIMEVWVVMLRQEPIEMHKLMERVKGRDNNSVGGEMSRQGHYQFSLGTYIKVGIPAIGE